MNVATYRNWGVDGDNVSFFDKQFARLVAEFTDLRFWDWATGAQLRDGSGKANVSS